MAKFKKQLFNQKEIFFGMTLLHAHAEYIYIVIFKSTEFVSVQVEFPAYALSSDSAKKYFFFFFFFA